MITHNLPQQAYSFVGRKTERVDIVQRLSDLNCRLLTIVGPGGIGKTRLAAQVSGDIVSPKSPHRSIFHDGIYFVALQALISSDFNLSAIADSLQLQNISDGDPEEQLLNYLRPKSLLLVLDNFEHLLDGVGLISRLLAAAPYLKVLATSRQALNIQEEWLYRLDGMTYPTVQQTEGDFDSVRFFADHARRVQSSFSMDQERAGVARICQLVQGMPLALELAASWMRSLSANEIANEIERGLDIFEARTSNVPDRHRNMRVALDGSWQRLSEQEQMVLKYLSVFRGGFTREAAEAVAQATRQILAALVDKSWLKRDSSGRYDFHELLRQYGGERLDDLSQAATTAHDRHCQYFVDFLAPKWKLLSGEQAKQTQDTIALELENIWSFWDWAASHQRATYLDPVLYSLWCFYNSGNRFQEGVQLFGKAAHILGTTDNHILYGKLLMYQGIFCHNSDHPTEAEKLLNESLRLLQPLGMHRDHAFCLGRIGIVTFQHVHDIAQAKYYFETSHSIFRHIGFLQGVYEVQSWIGIIYMVEENHEKAKQTFQEALQLAKSCDDLLEMGSIFNLLGMCASYDENYSAALNYTEDSLDCFQKAGAVWGIAMENRYMASIACKLRQFHKAQQHILQALTVEQKYHLARYTIDTFNVIAELWIEMERYGRAVELLSLAIHSPLITFPEGVLLSLERLKAQLPIEEYEAAFDRGKKRDFDLTLSELLTEFGEQVNTEISNPLTKRETEILHLIAQGHSNQAIADKLVLTVGSVKWYVKEIFLKLDVVNRTHAVARARELHLLSD